MTPLKLMPLMALAALAACDERDDDEAQILDFAQLNAINLEIIDKVQAAGPTPALNIPDGGTATYRGAMTFVLQDGSMDGVIGQAEVDANFATNQVSGGAGNFFDLDGNATLGSVSLENVVIADDFGNLIAGEVNGNITFAAGAMDVQTMLAGTFSGPNAELVSGVVSGTATPIVGDAVLVQGGIFAEQ